MIGEGTGLAVLLWHLIGGIIFVGIVSLVIQSWDSNKG